jgi:hypothetical protein
MRWYMDREERIQQSQWHSWFAWRPVIVRYAIPMPHRTAEWSVFVWLERIDRKGEYHGNYLGGHWEWEYRLSESDKERLVTS